MVSKTAHLFFVKLDINFPFGEGEQKWLFCKNLDEIIRQNIPMWE